jgi:tRNA (guanine-N7-)-methyltransferase
MGQKKLQRFAELNKFQNVLQFPQNISGEWKVFFHNDHPLVLELACGKGEYTLGLAQLYPDKNFLGIDVKGNRLWVGARKALQLGLKNAGFLRIEIEGIANYFSQDEVDEIWITFPDPQLRDSKAKKRLTHPRFLRLYHSITKPGAKIHLKTDSPDLYQFTQTVIKLYNCTVHVFSENLYGGQPISAELEIKTHYEQLDIAGSKKIYYCCFSLPADLPGKETDEKLKQLIKKTAHEKD